MVSLASFTPDGKGQPSKRRICTIGGEAGAMMSGGSDYFSERCPIKMLARRAAIKTVPVPKEKAHFVPTVSFIDL